MQLSAEVFEQMIAGVKGDTANGSKDQRKHARVGLRCRIHIIPVEASGALDPIDVWTRDISPGGVGVMSSKRLNAGKRFAVRFPRNSGEPPLVILCTVKNCTELAPGIFAIGAAFESVTKQPSKPILAALALVP